MVVFDINAVVERAAEERRDVYRRLPNFGWTESWLTSFITGTAYAPTGPDWDGWITVGEVDDKSGFRLGFVLFKPATGEHRVVWTEGRLPVRQPAMVDR